MAGYSNKVSYLVAWCQHGRRSQGSTEYLSLHIQPNWSVFAYHSVDTPKPISLDLDVASQGWDLLFQYHGRPSGIYAADEYLAGLEAIRG